MSDRDPDKEIWQRFRASDPAIADPDADALAAWEEDKLSGRSADLVEKWLADDALARAVFAAEPVELSPPARAIRRARSLVRSESPFVPWQKLFYRRAAFVTAAGAASMLVLVASFNLGSNAHDARNYAEDRIATALWSDR